MKNTMKKLIMILALFICGAMYAQSPGYHKGGVVIDDPSGTSADPVSLEIAGKASLYWNATLAKFRQWDGSSWGDLDFQFYDGIDTTANILLKNPTTSLGESWWSSDDKVVYKAVSSTTQGVDVWQSMALLYDATNDTFKLATTQDGQTQNLGQEIFFAAYNDNGSGATTLNPKLFISTGVKVGEENIDNIIKATKTDLAGGSLYGLNTVDANVGDYTKIVTYGDVNDVDTSAWVQGTILYADLVAGELTDVKPSSQIFPIAIVTKSDATEGKLFVNTISSPEGATTAIPAGFDRVHYTADEITVAAGTFFLGKRNDTGILTSDTSTAIVPDDSQVVLNQNIIGTPIGFPVSFPAGLYTGQVEFQVNGTQGEQRIRLEYYISEADGTPVDSGILTEPVGALGVRPALRTTSQLYDAPANVPTFAVFQGQLANDVPLGATQRVRTVIICEKIGTQGGDVTFTVYFGSDHASYTDTPALFEISDNIDVDTSGSITNHFLKKNASGIWQGSVIEPTDINGLDFYEVGVDGYAGSSYLPIGGVTLGDHWLGMDTALKTAQNDILTKLDATGKAADSELLDGIDSGSFLRSDINEAKTAGYLRFDDGIETRYGTGSDSRLRFDGSNTIFNLIAGDLLVHDNGVLRHTFGRTTGDLTITGKYFGDGSSISLVDALTLNGVGGTSFLRSDAGDVKTSGNTTYNDFSRVDLGTGGDMQLYHNGAENRFNLIKGDLKIQNNGTDIVAFGRTTGNLGLGVTDPLTKLEVYENNAPAIITIKGGLNSQTTLGNEIGSLDFRSNDTSVPAANDIAARISAVAEHANGALVGLAFHTTGSSLAEQMRLNNLGYLGIGTDTPAVALDISHENPFLRLSDKTSTIRNSGVRLNTAGGEWYLTSGFSTGVNSEFNIGRNNSSAFLSIGTTGDVKIGSTAQRFLLRNDGVFNWGSSANYGTLSWNTNEAIIGGLSGSKLSLSANGSTKATILTTGEFGIGEDTPTSKLHLKDSSVSPIITIENGDTSLVANQEIGGIDFKTNDASGGGTGTMARVIAYSKSTGDKFGNIGFYTADRVAVNPLSEKMTIDYLGRVGIGETDPTEALDVVGNIVATGGINGAYKTTLTLSAAQLDNLFATPIEIIPAQGAGKVVAITNLIAFYDYGTTGYTGATTLNLEDSGTSLFQAGTISLLNATADKYSHGKSTGAQEASANSSINVVCAADLSGGDGTVKLVVTYEVVDFN